MRGAEAFEAGLQSLIDALSKGEIDEAERLVERLESIRASLAVWPKGEEERLRRVQALWRDAVRAAEARARACRERLAARMRASRASAVYEAGK